MIAKPFTAELGNVTPVIIVPGPWSERELREQALHLASWLTFNAGFQCHAPRVIVQHRGWDRRRDFLQRIGDRLATVDTHPAFYPGARERHAVFLDAHPKARLFGERRGDRLPWTLIPDVVPDRSDDCCFNEEAFCGLCAETALPASTVPEFIDRAVDFANRTLWGTLCAAILVHPRSLADPATAAALGSAIADLRYGMVCVNVRVELGFNAMQGTWGGFPHSDIYDFQSGFGHTHNALMFERPQKTVVRGPFGRRPYKVSVATRRMDTLGERLARAEVSPSLPRRAALLLAVLRM